MTSNGSAIDEGFLGRTYISTVVLTVVILVYLCAYGQKGLALPVTLGVLLSLGMLYVSDLGVRQFFQPLPPPLSEAERGGGRGLEKKEEQKRPGSRTVLLFVLIKYALVGVAAYAVAKFTAPLWQIAFVGGFCLTHFNIALRTVSRLVLGLNESNGRGNLRATTD